MAARAGIQHARIPTAISTAEIVTNVVGSVGVTRTSKLFITRARQKAAARPSTRPMAAGSCAFGGFEVEWAATDSPPRPQPQASKPSGGAPLTPMPENCAFSVDPASAAVEQPPPEITCCTSSK